MQYDLAGSPLGSRKSLLNAYATSGYGNASTLDLARTAILTPLLKLNLTLLNREWISSTTRCRNPLLHKMLKVNRTHFVTDAFHGQTLETSVHYVYDKDAALLESSVQR